MGTSAKMNSLVEDLGSNPTEPAMQALVDLVRTTPVTDEEIANIAMTLGTSGTTYAYQHGKDAADLASTGAPTSLSTLLGPLYIRSMGFSVPKLGVPGRPAGGVDTLAQLPGYRINLTYREVMACLERCGYAHFLANQDHAPLDARFFRFRRQSKAPNLPELAIASLLSKKIAVGLKRIGLDIRVAPHGNFGDTWDKARNNAQLFQRVASILGIDSVCFLTDARFPYQPFVGRGESLAALKEIFSGTQEQSLVNHATQCLSMARTIVHHANVDPSSTVAMAEKYFYENLLAQGSTRDAFDEYVDKVRTQHRFQFIARDQGFVCLSIEQLRALVLRFQKACAPDAATFPDGMGVILRKSPGEFVQSGDLLATIRVAEKEWHSVETELKKVLSISSTLEFAVGFERVING